MCVCMSRWLGEIAWKVAAGLDPWSLIEVHKGGEWEPREEWGASEQQLRASKDCSRLHHMHMPIIPFAINEWLGHNSRVKWYS